MTFPRIGETLSTPRPNLHLHSMAAPSSLPYYADTSTNILGCLEIIIYPIHKIDFLRNYQFSNSYIPPDSAFTENNARVR